MPSQIESRELASQVPWCEIPRLGLRFCLIPRSSPRFLPNETGSALGGRFPGSSRPSNCRFFSDLCPYYSFPKKIPLAWGIAGLACQFWEAVEDLCPNESPGRGARGRHDCGVLSCEACGAKRPPVRRYFGHPHQSGRERLGREPTVVDIDSPGSISVPWTRKRELVS
jgi:hypothetical protein